MTKAGFLLIITVLASQVISGSAKYPRDVASEVQELLQELATLVDTEILHARNKLEDLEYDYYMYGFRQQREATAAIEQEQEQIQQQLDSIKELAQSAQEDIGGCTRIREELLGRLPEEYVIQSRSCIAQQNNKEADLLLGAMYIIDIFVNKVHNFEFQIERCQGDVQCLTPLISEIELDRVRIPEDIKKEVDSVETLLNGLTLSVGECAKTAVSEYVSEASALLRDIAECVEKILGGQQTYGI